MRKIVFNGEQFFKDELFGISRNTYELLRELDKMVSPGIIVVLSPHCKMNEIELNNIKVVKIGFIVKKSAFFQKITRFLWKYIIFRFYCRIRRAISVNTFPAWRFFDFDIVSIYDCTPELFYINQSKNKEKISWYERIIKNQKRAVARCKIVLTDSNSAKKDIERFYSVDDKVRVIPCGWQHFNRITENNQIIEKLDLSGKQFYFSLGSRMPHKNIKWISHAAKKNPNYYFVITGSDFGYTNKDFEGKKLNNMIFTGYLSDEEIKALMHYCKAFIQPSFYEGFGIPPMEAMSVGADCIVSNAGSLPEVYKNSVWYIDPYDYDNIDLNAIMSSPKDSNELILKEYSWEKSARTLLSVLQEISK